MLHEFAHYLLQTPFRRMGKCFTALEDAYNTSLYAHKKRHNSVRLGTMRLVLSLALISQQLVLVDSLIL